jgi:hypothetical protein
MTTENSGVEKETDLLKYESNKVPRVIRFVWTLMIVFMIYYLMQWSWPDLKVWLEALRK